MKQRILYLFAMFIMAMAYVSCDNETFLAEKTNPENDVMIPYSREDIIAKANYFYGMLPGHTRNSSPRVRGLEKVFGETTRGEESPSYYIVNYEDEAGFVMVGGNEAADPVVALSDEGNLQLSDTLSNPALGEFINSVSRSHILTDRDVFQTRPIETFFVWFLFLPSFQVV
ncbi:MAG: Spi family protease inhibitor [Muribaculaceae bacterium]|nr:Spi family protease inhibitor [Muribaculaceae bacterium]